MTSASDTLQAGPGSVSEDRSALIAGITAYTLWGGLSLLFMALGKQGVGSWEITAQRCLWSLPWSAGLVVLARTQGEAWAVLRNPRTLLWLTGSAILVSVNWAIFVFASTTGHKLDASLGYYINPLLNMAAGAALFRERISKAGLLAIALACIGVTLQAFAVGHPPWVALSLAVTFWAYGVIKKQVKASAPVGLFVECLMLAPIGLGYLIWLNGQGTPALGANPIATLLILATGPATVIPLALFAFAMRRLPLSAMGFLQFVMPTIAFVIAMATGEAFTPLTALAFAFIWAGVAVFSFGSLRAASRFATAGGRSARP
ncbi:MAG: EamA family transporter RarD [Caulobacteraceae bacterium]